MHGAGARVNRGQQRPTPRVLMVSGEYPPALGGVGDYTARLVEALREHGVGVEVLTTTSDRHSSALAAAHPEPLGPGLERWSLGAFPRVLAAARAAQADVVHVQYQAGAYALSGAVTLLP